MGPLQNALTALNDAPPDNRAAPGNHAAPDNHAASDNRAAHDNHAASDNHATAASPAGAAEVRALSAWLSARGLPAPPWAPDPDWLQAPLPRLVMPPEALVTLSAIANLRAQVVTQFGLDPLVPVQANMFARLAATLSARVSAMADNGVPVGNGHAWQQLAAQNTAIDQVSQAVRTGVFAADPKDYAIAPAWQPFLAGLRSLLPLICIGVQFGLDLRTNFSADLAAAVRAMLTVRLPALPAANLDAMASLSRQLFAVASLKASLGVSPLQAGLATVQRMVLSKRQALPATAVNNLPAIPYCPTVAVTPAMVQAALTMNPEAVAALTWRAPALTSVPLLQVGLPVANLSTQLSAALGIRAAVTPCPTGCDANAVLRAAFAA